MAERSRRPRGGLTPEQLLARYPAWVRALAGAGIGAFALAILGAVAGAWVYGYLQPKLPH